MKNYSTHREKKMKMSPSTKRARVHWALPDKLEHVRYIKSSSEVELASCCLTASDYANIRRDNKLIVDLIEADLFVENRTRCRRGLESKTWQGQALCEARRQKVMRALFTEQAKQRKSQVYDPNALARAAQSQSHEACSEAYVRGVSDSNVAKVLLATDAWGSSSMKSHDTPRVIVDDPIYLVVLEQRKQDLLLCPTNKIFPSVA